MVEYKERRRFPRYVCDTGVRIHPEKGHAGYWGTVGDISLGGCYVFTFSPLPAGQVVKQIAPIWKREFFDGGDVWIEGATADPSDARARAEAERVACA